MMTGQARRPSHCRRGLSMERLNSITLKSRIPYVRCGGRLIGPMDEPDAKALAAAMNAVLRPDQAGTARVERVC
ncbi:hypothetical protein [Paracoccus haematequi]|uniref:hypothetical protein n=1 Tax=Paracoccus haematequi TaxID=2491866 RepID=UPI000F7F304E|nr:hypothetical protein [Paracoccus haematequi]